MVRIHNPENYKLLGFELGGKKHKYIAILENIHTTEKKQIPFGGKYLDGTPYEQFEDKIGYYKEYDHKDLKRRWRYLKRHEKEGDHKFSSSWFSKTFLW
jgi:hypothetical protein